jgi:hypothetical protein
MLMRSSLVVIAIIASAVIGITLFEQSISSSSAQTTSYQTYKKTNVFPEGTIFFKELQLTLPPAANPDRSRTEPSGRGYFPGPLNGADVTVKDTKRYTDTGGWGCYNFNHHEPKAPTAAVKAQSECAFWHQASAKKDEVWTQFYPLLDK